MNYPIMRVFVPVLLSMLMSGPLMAEDGSGTVAGQSEASGSTGPSAIDESMTAQTPPESAANTLPPAPAHKATHANVAQLPPPPSGAEISQGERLTIDGKGFSIVAPTGWIVQRNLPRSSLFLQARVIGAEYPRNIAVVRFNESVLINESTANGFAERLVKLYPAASSTIENYTLRNHQSIQMADGREGILFYTDFTGSGRKMMQAHILVSSETNHYLVTYTDVAEHFENPGDNSPFLAEAWSSMTSIQLDSPNPVPTGGMDTTVMSLIGIVIIGGAAAIFRKIVAGIRYKEYATQAVSEGGDLTTKASSSVSGMDTSMYAPTGKTENVTDSDYADDGEESGTTDDGISSGIGGRLLKFRKKPNEVDDSQNDGAGDLEFTEDAVPKQKLKRGA